MKTNFYRGIQCFNFLLFTFLFGINAVYAGQYPERNIEFVVGFKPGGGYSDWAQAVAPFIEKHLPKKVNVIVRHMEGAGSAIAATYVQNAKPDGYTIAMYNIAGLAATQTARPVKYDLSKVTWLGRLALDDRVALVSAKGPYKGIEDFKKQAKPEFIVATVGLASAASISGAVTFAKLGVKWKPLNHGGSGEAVLAVIRGDADIVWGSLESAQQYIDSGDLRPVVYYSARRHPAFRDVPIPSEVGMPELNEMMSTHYLIGAPPGVPADIRAVLEEAVRKSLEDPEFLAVARKIKRSPSYLSGKGSEKVAFDTLKGYQTYAYVVKDLLSQDKK